MTADRKNYLISSIFFGISFVLTIYILSFWYFYFFTSKAFTIFGIINTKNILDLLIFSWIVIWLWAIAIYFNYIGNNYHKIKENYRKFIIFNTRNEKEYQRSIDEKGYN